MEKYLLLKLGMNISEVEKVLEEKITAVDGIKIGMNMNEVEKIKGLPEKIETSDEFPEMVDWFYYSKNIVYYFIDNKVDDISFHDFNGNYFTNEDIEKLLNAADGVYEYEKRNYY